MQTLLPPGAAQDEGQSSASAADGSLPPDGASRKSLGAGGRRGSNASATLSSHSRAPSASLGPASRAEAYVQRSPARTAHAQVASLGPGPPAWKLRGLSRGAGRRTAALFLSIRSLMVIASVLEVGGAIACTWAITYFLGVRNLDSVARLLVLESHDHMRVVIERYLDRAHASAEIHKKLFQRGILSTSQWRLTLAKFRESLAAHSGGAWAVDPPASSARRRLRHQADEADDGTQSAPYNPVFQNFVRFHDWTLYGMHRCSETDTPCPTGYRAFFGNATYLSSFSADENGQPTDHLFGGPFSSPLTYYEDAFKSRRGCTWSGVTLRGGLNSNGNPFISVLDRLMLTYSCRVNTTQPYAGPPAASLVDLPAPLLERFGASDAAPVPSRSEGVVVAAMHLTDISATLEETLPTPDSVAFLTTEGGSMIASSVARLEEFFDSALQRSINARESPSAVVRAAYTQDFSALPSASGGRAGRVLTSRIDGRQYFLGSSHVIHYPNLKWSLYLAVPRDTLLEGINGSIVINTAVNSVWLVVSIVVAVLLGLRITKPLVTLRQSMVQLAQTMTSMASEFRAEAASAAGGPVSPATSAPAGRGFLGLSARRVSMDDTQGHPRPLGSATSRSVSRPLRSARFSLTQQAQQGGDRDRGWWDAAATPEPGAGRCWKLAPWPWRSRRRVDVGAGAPRRPEDDLEAAAACRPASVHDEVTRARQSVALGTGLQELAAFEEIIRAMQSGFTAFRDMSATELALMRSLLAERKTKLEMEVRADETRKFISTMSHEMRTPLNGILGMLQLARDCELSEEAAEFVEAASLSGEHLLSIVNDVLDLQKIEAGLIELQIAPTRVVDVVNSSVRIVQPRAGAKGLVLSVHIAADVPPLVMGDPDRTRQCLLNLVSNAVKYTVRGTVEVRVTVEAAGTDPDGSVHGGTALAAASDPAEATYVLKFSVSDTGPGISSEAQRQLFTRFYRVRHDPAFGPDPGGTGLGLAISKEIIAKMGGDIGCFSEMGHGSTFWFTIPLQPAILSPPHSVRAWQAAGPGFGGVGGGGEAESCGDGENGSVHPVSADALSPAFLSSASEMAGGSSAAPSNDALVRHAPAGTSSHESSAQDVRGSMRQRASADSADAANSLANTITSFQSGSAAPHAHAHRPPLSILVAEDNAMNMRVLRTMLEKEGHRVTEARDGREAVGAFEGAADPEFVAMVFMDCSMPLMDGLEATRRIRELERQRGWRRHFIVALTGHANAEDGDACLAAGMDKWLTKPIRKALLLEAVEQGAHSAEGRRHASLPLPAPPAPAPAASCRSASMPLVPPPAPAPAPPPPLNVYPPGASPSPVPEPVLALGPHPPSLSTLGREPPHSEPAPSPERAVAAPSSTASIKHVHMCLEECASEEPDRERLPPTAEGPHGDKSAAASSAGGSARSGGACLERDGSRDASVESASFAAERRSSAGGELEAEGRPPALEVLIADDNQMNRRVLRALLAKEGHRVDVAEDGAEAVAMFEGRARDAVAEAKEAGVDVPRHVYDVIFMDVSMPRMDGLQATRRIREIERELLGAAGSCPVPVVACTALSSSQDHANALAAGLSDLIVKPVTRAGLAAALAKWCGGRRSGSNSGSFAPPSEPSLQPGAAGVGGYSLQPAPGRRSSSKDELRPSDSLQPAPGRRSGSKDEGGKGPGPTPAAAPEPALQWRRSASGDDPKGVPPSDSKREGRLPASESLLLVPLGGGAVRRHSASPTPADAAGAGRGTAFRRPSAPMSM